MLTKKSKYIQRIGIKGTVDQLSDSVFNLIKILNILGDSLNFNVEIDLENEKRIGEKLIRDRVVNNFIKLAKKYKKETGYSFSGVILHMPFKFRNLDFNLLSLNDKQWENSIKLIEILLNMAKKIENKTKIKTRIIIHIYSLNPFEDEYGNIIDKRGVYEFTKHHRVSGIEKALKRFPLKERKMIGIETTGIGPCSTPKELISIAKKTNCFIVQDVGHLTRYFYIDKNLKVHSNIYDTEREIKNVIEEMLPYTKHWHICQHPGGIEHHDWHLAMPGIINWPDLIPLMIKSFKKNDATAIIEVKSKDYSKPKAGIGSFLLFREMVMKKS